MAVSCNSLIVLDLCCLARWPDRLQAPARSGKYTPIINADRPRAMKASGFFGLEQGADDYCPSRS